MSRLTLHAVTKRFGALAAVAPLTCEYPAGSIQAVLGENGAGKSTLVRMIAGVTPPSAGTIQVDGRVVPTGDPRLARAAGIGVVHQHFALVGALSVAENLLLGRAEDTRRFIRPAALVREAETLAAEHGLDIGDPRTACRTLPVGTLARVEILRALTGHPRILLLDEPTAVLTPTEVSDLFVTLRRLRDEGMLILFVTHKLDEALALCDAVTVLRRGRVVGSHPVGDVSAEALAALMVGEGNESAEPAPPAPLETRRPPSSSRSARLPTLDAHDLRTPPQAGRVTLGDIALRVEPGEIRGVAGVDGNGQDELARALAGLGPRTGSVVVAGVALPSGSVRDAQAAGVALIASDRQRDGLALDLSVAENAILAAPLLDRFAPHGLIDAPALRAFAERLVADYRVTTTSIDQPVRALSGGNQQRIVIGRTLALQPRLLIAVNPTRGLDIVASAQVHAMLRTVAAGGTAVLLISTDLDELLGVATAIQVLFRGRLSAPISHADRDTLGRLMAGLPT